ncbi:hypothetical protein PFISCL1PPCAC_8975, partial [Pristionchus fissidentatus]
INVEKLAPIAFAVFDFIFSVIAVRLLAYLGVWSDNNFITWFFVCVGPIASPARKLCPPLSFAKLTCNSLWLIRLVLCFNKTWGMVFFIVYKVCSVFIDCFIYAGNPRVKKEMAPFLLEANVLKVRAAAIERKRFDRMYSQSQ